ncbi:NAD(P)H-dependent oxidoreductase [Anaerotardibacter muris]|uniref:NAD(P)H-dependent oxidoreductase n=1 Tax=Anaerotardibacter muris TaxID=2941505 RepID=UPI002040743C|nr:NAD(P)H-dependent oxidoreductase [Anaerotardibacter muris]
MKVYLINAHLPYPNWSEGELNASCQSVAKEFFLSRGDEVVEIHIADGYDPEVEAQKWLDADAVVLQTPINWFSAPWIWKKYEDEVFNVGLHRETFLTGDGRTRHDPSKQYGSGGLMAPRKVMVCTTMNAPREAFDNPTNPTFQGRSCEDMLSDITDTFRFCGMEVLPSFAIYDIFKNPEIEKGLDDYRKHLEKHFA